MRFELTVAFKYLIPRWRQLSVSIISLLSILVISLVVWLVVLFLSVTEGIEKRWIEELVTFNAPVKIAPTEAYYNSYYYQIDNHSSLSNYGTKTIGEKLAALQSDPYDPAYDMELPADFPTPDKNEDGSLKDPVKGAWEALSSLSKYGPRPQEYEVTFGNLKLNMLHDEHESYISQVSYVSSLDAENKKLDKILVPLTVMDYQNLLHSIANSESGSDLAKSLAQFFRNLEVTRLDTAIGGYILPPSLYPTSGEALGVGIQRGGEIYKIVLPAQKDAISNLQKRLELEGHKTEIVRLNFEKGRFRTNVKNAARAFLTLDEKIPLQAEVVSEALPNVRDLSALQFHVKGHVQNLDIAGTVFLKQLEIGEIKNKKAADNAPPLWIYQEAGSYKIPESDGLGTGMLVSKQFKNSGVRLGDRGYLSYYSPTASSMQEQRLPVYVAGFYDPGMLPVGGKLLFVDPSITALLRNGLTVSDNMLGNGVNVWIDDVNHAHAVKEELKRILDDKGIGKYWQVQSFHDYDFSRPILEQLNSDKNLFTLIALIILIVACSNVISMLILLVNDKKKEIGILQSMGASPRRIATIFGICGFTTGLISSILGIAAAVATLHHLQPLVDFLGFLQGHEVFQAAFYGKNLPNQISYHALTFVTIATLSISLLAGMIPAIKAARIRPTEILRSE